MEPTPGEYPSKMRVALVRRNPADGAAPLGLKKSRTSKSLQPYPFTPLSLSPSGLSPSRRCEHPAAGPDRTPPATSAAPPATAQPGADARSSRGQGSGPTAPTARQERTAPGRAGRGPAPTPRQEPRTKPPAPPAGSFPGRRASAPAPPGSRSRGRHPPRSTGPLPPLVPPLFKVNPLLFPVDPCWIVHPCSCVKDI